MHRKQAIKLCAGFFDENINDRVCDICSQFPHCFSRNVNVHTDRLAAVLFMAFFSVLVVVVVILSSFLFRLLLQRCAMTLYAIHFFIYFLS